MVNREYRGNPLAKSRLPTGTLNSVVLDNVDDVWGKFSRQAATAVDEGVYEECLRDGASGFQ
jgi:hypothetical protein